LTKFQQESVYVGEYALIISHKRYLTAVREILSRVEAKGEVSTKLNPFVSEIQEQCDYMCELEEEIEKLDRETERLEEQARLIEEYPPDITEGHIAFIDAFELGLIVPDMLNLMDFFQSGGAL
jgi:predicted ribosome quality control (RQC) complex YloA/Tae2 family protein